MITFRVLKHYKNDILIPIIVYLKVGQILIISRVKIGHLVLAKVYEEKKTSNYRFDNCVVIEGTSQSSLLAESLIWEYVVQISSFIRTLHGLSLACRCLYLSRILVDGDSRMGRGKSR
jgi:hypothetical protein